MSLDKLIDLTSHETSDGKIRIKKPHGLKIFLMVVFLFPLYFFLLYLFSKEYKLDPVLGERIYFFFAFLPVGLVLALSLWHNRFIEIKSDMLIIWKGKNKKEREILKSEIEEIKINQKVKAGETSGYTVRNYGGGTKKLEKTPVFVSFTIKLLSGEIVKYKVSEVIMVSFREKLDSFNYPLLKFEK